ncbi:MAG: sulfite exporter TauE/SafE family protein [Cytophagaceae bacterium]|nr:sulfite exporter TauE/SafE family protein [Cytophagaceae bacterium]
MFWAAFLLGLVGSLHCVGMCGPLTLLLPQTAYNSYKFIFGRLLYNGGRIITYSLLGASVGFFGEKLSFLSLKNHFLLL